MTESTLRNQDIHCRDCGQDFTFTVGEQQFFLERNLKKPTRCKQCRKAPSAKGKKPIVVEVYTRPRRKTS